MPQIYGKTNLVLPTGVADGNQAQIRTSRYGDIFGIVPLPEGIAGAGEGTYFKATNPTFGTGIAQSIQATWVATNAIAILRNTSASATGPTIYPSFIRLICTAAGSTTSSGNLGITIDNSNRYSSGGSSLTPVNANMGSAVASVADVKFGAITATAASGSVRQVSRAQLKTQASPCWTIGDEVIIVFGDPNGEGGNLSGTTTLRMAVPVGSVALPANANHSMIVHLWNTANVTTAPSWEVEMGWWER